MNIVILGSKGYLGSQFAERFPSAHTPSIDAANSAEVATMLEELKPDVLINCAGKTGVPNVDWCEDHKLETLRGNLTIPLVLLEECSKRNIYWVHLSSGCIYEGDNGGRGFSEDDIPNFHGSFYSRTKAWSDQMLRDFPILVLRLRMPFDATDQPRNLLSKLKKYTRVLDAKNSITFIPDFLDTAIALIEKKKTGTYNVVNPGGISPYEIMELYKKIIQPEHSFERLTLDDLPQVAKAGRSNCILNTAKLEKEGIHLRSAKEVVEDAFMSMKK